MYESQPGRAGSRYCTTNGGKLTIDSTAWTIGGGCVCDGGEGNRGVIGSRIDSMPNPVGFEKARTNGSKQGNWKILALAEALKTGVSL